MFWLLFSFLTILFAYFGDEKVSGKKYAVYFRILLILTLSYVVGFGGGMFTDHKPNIYQFYHFGRMQQLPIKSWFDLFFGKIDDVEVGYVLFVKLIYSLNFSEVGLFFIVAIITNTLIINTFYRFEYPVCAVFIFLTGSTFIQEFNLVRQEFAIALLLSSLKYVEERNLCKYLFCVFLAFWIHHSSLLGLLFLPLFYKKTCNKWLLLSLLGLWLVTIYISVTNYGGFDMTEISILIGSQTEYDQYLTNTNMVGTEDRQTPMLYNVLILFFFIFYKLDESKRVYAIFFVLIGVLGNLSTILPNLYRVQIVFLSVYPLFVPHMFKNTYQNHFKKIFPIGMLGMVLLYHTYVMIVNTSDNNLIGKKMDSVFDLIRSTYV